MMLKNLRNKIKTSPRAGEVGAPLRVRGTREQTVGIYLRLFSSARSVILRRERSELSRESRNIMSLLLTEGNSTISRLFSVIFWLVPKILLQQVTNQVNKLALLFKRSMLSQDCRNASGNDGCCGRWLSVCYQFFKRIYHPGSSANELSLKAKDDYKSVLQLGRSMIEMLGVLAIIGVLSVGGIAGYSKAMEKFKVNKAISEYSLLIFGILEHLDDLRPTACDNTNFCGLASYYQAANLLPGNWIVTDDAHIYDSNGNIIFTFVRNKRIGFDLYLGAATGSSKFPQKLCKELFTNLVKPLHSSLYHAGIWGNVNGGNYLYGDNICQTDGLKCLRDISLSEINSLCKSCADGEACCIGIEF